MYAWTLVVRRMQAYIEQGDSVDNEKRRKKRKKKAESTDQHLGNSRHQSTSKPVFVDMLRSKVRLQAGLQLIVHRMLA